MIFSTFIFITALLIQIAYSGVIYSTRSFPYAYYSPSYALKYSYHPSLLIPYTYSSSAPLYHPVLNVKDFEMKHHHPDHHGTEEDYIKEQETQMQNNVQSTQMQSSYNNPPISIDTTYPAVTIDPKLSFPFTSHTNELKYGALSKPVTIVATTEPKPLSWPISAQFHQQNGLGQYYYGYAYPDSSKQEIQTMDGITRGSYSYIDAYGKLQTVAYISDDVNGFRVAATNLPKQTNIPDSPDVALAKQEHFQAQKEALDRLNAANAVAMNNDDDDSNINNDNNQARQTEI